MIISGLCKFSLIDYPGKMCAIIYTCGCNFRCPYCHNPELVYPEQYAPAIPLEEVLDFLRGRQGLLEAVTVTGGEPTLHKDLPEMLRAIKSLGFLVKLDSNGCNPAMLRDLIDSKTVDYVAMDVKAPLDDYGKAIGVDLKVDGIVQSIQLLMQNRVDYEFRVTVDRSLLDEADLLAIGASIRGAKCFYLQKLNDFNSKDEGPKASPEDEVWLEAVAEKLREVVDFCDVR
jgi:pyruvate formate lyase activating enzyme